MNEEHRTSEATASDEASRRTLTPAERILLLDLWQRSALSAREFGVIVGTSRHTLFDWKHRFDRRGPAGLHDHTRGAPRGSRLRGGPVYVGDRVRSRQRVAVR